MNKYLNQLGVSENTIVAYKYDVSKFIEYLEDNKVKSLKKLKIDNVEEYILYLKNRGKSDATVRRASVAIIGYCNYISRRKLIDFDIKGEKLGVPKVSKQIVALPTSETIESILASCNTATLSGLRDRAMLELLYASGLRVSELCDLQLSDMTRNKVLIRSGKGDKGRQVPVSNRAQAWLDLYAKEQAEYFACKKNSYFFLTLQYKQLSANFVWQVVKNRSKDVGVEGVSPHTLRHACATELLKKGASISVIQKILGHESIATTQRYLHLNIDDVQEAYNKCHAQ
jgi:integrase/recombinase XerD